MKSTPSRKRSRQYSFLRGAVGLMVALAVIAGCASYTPEQRAEIERAWAERDRERAAECAQRGGRFISSSCVGWGGP